MKHIKRILGPAAATALASLCVALGDGSSPTIPDPVPAKNVALVQPSDGSGGFSVHDDCGTIGPYPIMCLDRSIGS